MELTITTAAQLWFKREIALGADQGIRFYGKVYGKTAVHEGFSVGLSVDIPENPLVLKEVAGQLFFIENSDEWFFDGFDLVVDYNAELDEPVYEFNAV